MRFVFAIEFKFFCYSNLKPYFGAIYACMDKFGASKWSFSHMVHLCSRNYWVVIVDDEGCRKSFLAQLESGGE
jgi:hypothetical protein